MTQQESTQQESTTGEVKKTSMVESLWWGAALWIGSVALAVALALVVAPEAEATAADTLIEHTFIGY